MNEEFEAMPFQFGGEVEGALESERGRRPARARPSARPAGRGLAAKPRPGVRRGPTRPRPSYGPYYGWPDRIVLREPYPVFEPFAPQGPEPAQAFPDEPDDEPDGQGEVPPTLRATLARMPGAPNYLALGNLVSALRSPRTAGSGFYLIEFTVNGKRRAYSGQTGNLRRRLQQHALCGQMMGLPLAEHQVYVAPSSQSAEQRRAMEYRIHDDMFTRHPGVLTNQRRELELELLGQEWI
jgi:hypothetical protein